MRLDDSTLADTGFHDIRIDRALGKIVHMSDLLCLCFKDIDELSADDLALLLRIRYTLQLLIEVILCIDTDEVEFIRSFRSEHLLHFISLVLAQKTMIHKHAGQLLADCLGKKHSTDRRVNTAGQGT